MNIEEIRRIFLSAPFIADLGIELTSAEGGDCVTTVQIEPRHLQQDGFVHAGVDAAGNLHEPVPGAAVRLA